MCRLKPIDAWIDRNFPLGKFNLNSIASLSGIDKIKGLDRKIERKKEREREREREKERKRETERKEKRKKDKQKRKRYI